MSMGTATRAAYQRRMLRPAGSSFELWSWYFFRVSGVFLLLLVFGHLLIVHIINNVDVINYEFVAQRWQTIGWRMYDWLLLALAIVHGQNGLRILIDDYVHSRGGRALAHTANWVFLMFFLALGTLTIVSFPFMPGTIPPR
jgi:succinate dehydrogenase / fumarate reductase membrane anchor subunit